MNLANKLTIIRIALVPIFLFFITVDAIPNGKLIAAIVFIVAAITDKLDGYIARKRNQITNIGKFMDPLADKLLTISAFVSLIECGNYKVVPAWIAAIIIGRELSITGLRSIAASQGTILAASKWGKLKTVTQITAIICGLVYINCGNYIINILTDISLYTALIITIISGVDYFIKNKKCFSN